MNTTPTPKEPRTYAITTKNTPALALGVASFAVGVISLLIGWIPFLGLLAAPIALVGAALALIGLLLALAKKCDGMGMPLLGGMICIAAFALPIMSTKSASKAISEAAEKSAVNAALKADEAREAKTEEKWRKWAESLAEKSKGSDEESRQADADMKAKHLAALKAREEEAERKAKAATDAKAAEQAKADEEARKKADYIKNSITLYEIESRYMDSLLEGKLAGVKFKLRNKGEMDLSRVEVIVYFKDHSGAVIHEENFLPVLVSSSLFTESKPLKAGYVWQMEKGKFYSAKSVPSEWKEGSIEVKITDIKFAVKKG